MMEQILQLGLQEIVLGNLTFGGDVTVGDDLNLTTDSTVIGILVHDSDDSYINSHRCRYGC